jgi:formylglycine-generating enzyme required for sulfatase activity
MIRRSGLLNLRRALHAGFVISVAVYTARARPVGSTPPRLSYAGVLRDATGAPVSGPVDLRFRFKQGAAVLCEPLVGGVRPDPTDGAFTAAVDIASCPQHLLDGTETTFDVEVNGARLTEGRALPAVPFAKFADATGTPDCPPGYARTGETDFIACVRGEDEMVRVGSGSTAFWIDRFEASIWDDPVNPTVQYGIPTMRKGDYPPTFPETGQYTAPLYARSVRGVFPSSWINWQQAQAACEASGKRLPTLDEWFEAVRGVADPPGNNDGSGGTCLTFGPPTRPSGGGRQCRSAWGAEDMVGNFWEWTDAWFVGVGDGTQFARNWPYPGDDGSWNIASVGSNGTDFLAGLPGTARHGGSSLYGDSAGIFSFEVHISPAMSWQAPAPRCVIPR